MSSANKNKPYDTSRVFLVVMSSSKSSTFLTWFLVGRVAYWYLSTQKKKSLKKNVSIFLTSRKWNFKSRFWKTQKNHVI